MAYANIGGFNPVVGVYSGMVPTIVGSFFARTVLMVTTLTSAIALLDARGSKLMIVSVTAHMRRVFDRTGLTAALGEENMFDASKDVFGPLTAAVTDARTWVADRAGRSNQ